MQDSKGLFIVLEGADGSGKTTQFRLSAERLKAIGYDVETFDFPRYDEPSSYFVKRYLNGEYGSASEISPYTAALFYALDRYEAARDIRRALKDGKIVICNRYTGSSMAHQGSKFSTDSERRGFFMWIDSLEFELLGIPRPNINIFLKVPAEVSYELIVNKKARDYTKNKRDEHEADLDHLRRSVATYDLLCKLFPRDFREVNCTKNGEIMNVPEINDQIWEIIKPLLPGEPPHKARSVVLNLDEAIANTPKVKTEKSERAVEETRQTKKNAPPKDISLLAAEILNGVGDIKAPNLAGWTQAKSEADFRFYTPGGLKAGLAAHYQQTMKKLAGLYWKMRSEAKDNKQLSPKQLELALRAVIPLAALTDLPIKPEDQTAKLAQSPLPELQQLAKQLAQPTAKKSSALPKPSSVEDIIKQLAEQRLPQNLTDSGESLKLLEVNPRNEFDLLINSIYSYSNLSRSEIAAEIDAWSYKQKEDALKKALGKKQTTVLEQVTYRWDVTADRLTLYSLVDSGLVRDLQSQPSTPRFGYEVPEIIDLATLSDDFIECFDLSLELFSQMQAAGFEAEAPYSVLLGHKTRWQFSANGQLINELPRLGIDEQFKSALIASLLEVHPYLAAKLDSQSDVPHKTPQVVSAGAKSNRRKGRSAKK